MDWLLCVEILSILHIETQEITKLGGCINLSLPGVLALAVHRGRHNFVTILSADQVGCFEEDCSSVLERH